MRWESTPRCPWMDGRRFARRPGTVRVNSFCRRIALPTDDSVTCVGAARGRGASHAPQLGGSERLLCRRVVSLSRLVALAQSIRGVERWIVVDRLDDLHDVPREYGRRTSRAECAGCESDR